MPELIEIDESTVLSCNPPRMRPKLGNNYRSYDLHCPEDLAIRIAEKIPNDCESFRFVERKCVLVEQNYEYGPFRQRGGIFYPNALLCDEDYFLARCDPNMSDKLRLELLRRLLQTNEEYLVRTTKNNFFDFTGGIDQVIYLGEDCKPTLQEVQFART